MITDNPEDPELQAACSTSAFVDPNVGLLTHFNLANDDRDAGGSPEPHRTTAMLPVDKSAVRHLNWLPE